jgi:cell wall-associated NlpC family hydrolase
MFLKVKFFSFLFILTSIFLFVACNPSSKRKNKIAAKQSIVDTAKRFILIKKDITTKSKLDSLSVNSVKIIIKKDTLIQNVIPIKKDSIAPKSVIKPTANQQKVVDFAKKFIGKPYVYGSKNPAKGFDNSGFVNYVFENFKIITPRYGAAYIVTGNKIALSDAAEGDVILFSKNDSVKTVVNSLGIIISGKGQPIEFIHSTSGKVKGVTVTKMNSYYQKRLIAIRRVIN